MHIKYRSARPVTAVLESNNLRSVGGQRDTVKRASIFSTPIPYRHERESSNMYTALWIDGQGELVTKSINEPPKPTDGHALVKVLYSGINPADIKHADLGIKDTAAGYDFCGIVERTSPGSQYQEGDVIAGTTPTGLNRPSYYGTHQDYILCTTDSLVDKLPKNVPQADAACLAVTVRTAADALFNRLGFPLPGEGGDARAKGPLLIWAASTNLGTAAIQFAKAIDVSPIIATASQKNHALLKELGATECFDYKDPDVVSKIQQAVSQSGEPLLHIIDAIGSMETKSADTAAACAGSATTSEDLKVACATAHPKYPMPFAINDRDIELEIPHVGHITIPARPKDAERVSKAYEWALENYGHGFKIAKVHVVSGNLEEAMAAVKQSGEGKAPFGKTVIKHPVA